MRTSIPLRGFRGIIALLLLMACEPPAPKHKPAKFVEHKRVVDLTMAMPAGFTAHYNAIADSWRFESPTTTIVFERTPEASTASPEALRQTLHIDGKIEDRRGLSDGFTTTFALKDGAHALYVVRQIYNHDWFRCVSPVASDDVLALCNSLKRRRHR
jgi:hypothetical protein